MGEEKVNDILCSSSTKMKWWQTHDLCFPWRLKNIYAIKHKVDAEEGQSDE